MENQHDNTLCICCKSKFSRKSRGYYKWKVTSHMSPSTFTAVFQMPENLAHGTFICSSCRSIFMAKTTISGAKTRPCQCSLCKSNKRLKPSFGVRRRCSLVHLRQLKTDMTSTDGDADDGDSMLQNEPEDESFTPPFAKRVKHSSEPAKDNLGRGILMGMHEYVKPPVEFQETPDQDSNKRKACEGKHNTSVPTTKAMVDEEAKRTMADQRVQKIMKDPGMEEILAQIQSNPDTLKEKLQNPQIADKIQTLLDAGIIKSRAGSSILPSGSSILPSGSSILPSGSSKLPSDPSRQQSGPSIPPSGSSILPSGSSILPSGSSKLPSDPSRQQSGPSILPSGSSKLPSDPSRQQSGPSILPSGSSKLPSDPSRQQSGPSIPPSGSSILPSGSSILPSGSSKLPSDPSRQQSGPSILPSGSSKLPSDLSRPQSGPSMPPSGSFILPSGSSRPPSGLSRLPSDLSKSQSGPSRLQSGPSRLKNPQIPDEIQKLIDAGVIKPLGPSILQSGPSRLQSSPSRRLSGLSRLQSGQSNKIESSMSRIQAILWRHKSGPSRLQSGPSRLLSGPSRLQPGPSRLQSGGVLHKGPEDGSSSPASTKRLGNMEKWDNTSCISCKSTFKPKKKGGYFRWKVTSDMSPSTFTAVFQMPEKLAHGTFICSSCRKLFVTKTRTAASHHHSAYRRQLKPLKPNDGNIQTTIPTSTPAADKGKPSVGVDDDPSPPPNRPKTWREKAMEYIENSCYVYGFRQLCTHYPAAKRAMMKVVQEMIRDEVKAMRRKKKGESLLSQSLSIESVEAFRWDAVVDEAKETMPVAVTCMTEMLPTAKRVRIINQKVKGKTGSRRYFTRQEAKAYVNRRLGQMLSICMFTNSSKKFNFVQQSMAIELYRQGAPRKVIKMLNHSGVTINVDSGRDHVLSLVGNHDRKLKEWKNTFEELLPKMQKRWRVQFNARVPTFGLSVGCVHKWTEAKRLGRTYGKMETMCYAARNRVQSLTDSPKVVDAESLDPFVFLPSPDVIARQRQRIVDVVANIMGRHMKFLGNLSADLPITHEFDGSAAMSQKSETVTIGVLSVDPGTTEGMGTVLEHLQQYVPVTSDKPSPTLINATTKASKHILQVQKERADGESWKDRLDAFTPAPQEFNKQVRLLQDFNDVFFRGESKCEKGTIAQLIEDFNHTDFRKEVTLCDAWNIQRSWDLYELVTEGYTLLCALKFCGTSSLKQTPPGFPADGFKMEKLQWVQTVAQQVVDFVYHEPARSALKVAAEAYKDDKGEETEDALAYCRCKTEKEDEVIVCCSASCATGMFHLSCVGLTAAPDDDWYCSEECEESPSYIYCLCKLKCDPEGDTRLVQCALQGNCKGHEWYHYRCVGLQLTDVLPEKWYCSEACALDSENDDHVLNHSKALTLEGLRHLARRAAVRAGNGPVMVEDWKMDLLTFWSKKHSKFLVNAHHFLARVGGFAPLDIRTNLIWNRVININGKPGGNIGMDLGREFLCKEYRDTNASQSGIHVNKQRAENCGKMTGPFNQYLHTMFNDVGSVSTHLPTRTRSDNLHKQDIQKFIKTYQKSALFEYLPFREHKEFENFDGKDVLRNPRKLGQKLRALSRRLDSRRRIAKS